MNKLFFNSTILSLIISFPLSVCARDVMTPTVLVYPYDIAAQKAEVEQLVTDAVELSKKVEAKEQAISTGQEIFRDPEQYGRLRRMLNGYLAQIEERDKMLDVKVRQIEDLRTQLNEVRKSLAAAANSPAAPIVNKKNDDQRIQEELAQKNQYVNRLSDQVAHLKNELTDAKEALATAQAKVESPVVKIDEAKKDLPRESAQWAELKEELTKTKDALKAANAKYDELLDKSSKESFNKTQEIAKTGETITQNNARLEELKNKFDADLKSKDKEIVSLKEQLAAALADIKNLKVELAKDDAAFSIVRERGLALKEKLNAQAKELEEKEAVIKEFKSRVGQTESDATGQAQGLKKLKQAIEEQYPVLEGQLKESRAQAEMYSKNVKELKEQLAAAQNDYEKKQGETQGKMDDFQIKVDAKNARIAELEKINGAKIDTQAQANQTKIALLEEQLKQLRTVLVERDVNFKNLSEFVAQGKTNLANAQVRMRLHKDLDALRAKRIALLDEKGQLVTRKVETIKKESGIFIEKLSRNGAILNAQKQEANAANEILQQRLGSFTQEQKNLYFLKQQESAAQIIALYKEIREGQDKIESLSKDIAKKDEEGQKDKQDLYRLIERFKSRLKETADVNNDQSKSLAMHKAELDQYQEQQRSAQEEMQLKEERVTALLKELGEIKAASAEVKEQAKVKDLSLSMVQAMTDEKSKVHEALVAQFKDQLKSVQAELIQIKEKLAVAEAKLAQNQRNDDLVRLQQMLKSSREEIIQINALVKLKEGQIKDLQSGLDINAKEFEGQNQALEKIKVELQKQKGAIAKLTDDLLWKNKEIERLKLQLKDKIKTAIFVAAPERVKITEIAGDHEQLRNELKDSKEQIATLKEKLAQTQNVVKFLEKKLKHVDTN